MIKLEKVYKLIKTIILLSLVIFTSMHTSATLIPRKILFGNPDRTNIKLSHNGKYLSYLAPKDEVLNIWITDPNNLSEAIAITDEKTRSIIHYVWSFNNQDILYIQDDKGDENDRVYKYNIETKTTQLLTPHKGVKAHISGLSHKCPNEVLIGINDRDERYFDIYKFNLITLGRELIFKNDSFTDFVHDHNLKLRFAISPTEDGGNIYYQINDAGELKHFMTLSFEDVNNTKIVGFDKTNDNIYLLDTRDHNTSVLTLYNLIDNTSKVLAKSDIADIEVFTKQPLDGIVQAVTVNYDKITYQVLDESIEKDIKYLTDYNKGDLYILSRTLDDVSWIVTYENDDAPVKYYKYDRKVNNIELLFASRPELEKYPLLKTHPVVIKSRDGLNLVSYITFAPGNQPNPLVVLVHGGPWVRDTWGFNPVHQWLANRGYSVLSINYRGSSGFGKDFINASNMEWGNKMHNDLIDGVNWAIANKIADKDKIAIMGGSYGGYATLVGLTMTPDIFACGIDIVGPSNLITLIESIPPYWKPVLDQFKKRIGPWDTEQDKEFLKQRSPLTFASNIKRPLLIAQGANDPRVKQAESEQIVDAMKQANIPVIYALYEDEGHGFVREENKLAFFALVEYFLAEILGGKAEDMAKDSFQGANLLLNGQKDLTKEGVQAILDQAINGNTLNLEKKNLLD